MKISKVLSLLFVFGVLGSSFGYGSEISQKESEQKALEVIKTTTNMAFLLQAQKDLEIRKYDLYNAEHDRFPMPPSKHTVKDQNP